MPCRLGRATAPGGGRCGKDNLKLDHRQRDPNAQVVSGDWGRESTTPVDFAFLAKQTFGDAELERELLELFVAQARRVVPSLPELSDRRQADTAHLLKGSARGVGAWAAADAAAAYEAAGAAARPRAYAFLVQAFALAEAAIENRFVSSGR